jgi:hypothetical protein
MVFVDEGPLRASAPLMRSVTRVRVNILEKVSKSAEPTSEIHPPA